MKIITDPVDNPVEHSTEETSAQSDISEQPDIKVLEVKEDENGILYTEIEKKDGTVKRINMGKSHAQKLKEWDAPIEPNVENLVIDNEFDF